MSWRLALWLIVGVWSAVWYSNILRRNSTPEEIKHTPIFLSLFMITILGFLGSYMVYRFKQEVEPDEDFYE
jgi:predicted MFS family arabinose efflux permease